MAKLTELFKAIGNKKVVINESSENFLALLVRVDAEYSDAESEYITYDVQVVVSDLDGRVRTSQVLKTGKPIDSTMSVEDFVELNARAEGDNVVVGVNYYSIEEDDFAYHTETL